MRRGCPKEFMDSPMDTPREWIDAGALVGRKLAITANASFRPTQAPASIHSLGVSIGVSINSFGQPLRIVIVTGGVEKPRGREAGIGCKSLDLKSGNKYGSMVTERGSAQ